MRTYTTQMDAARQGIITPEMKAVAAKEYRTEEEINRAIAAIAARHAGLTIVVIAHRASSLEYCNRIITLGEK